MDHYPTVPNPFEPIIVPFLGGHWNPTDDVECLDLNLEAFRKRLLAGDVTLQEEDQVMATAQARLIFGMLYGVLQIDISRSDYVIGGNANVVGTLTTEQLKRDLESWKLQHDQLRSNCHSELHESADMSKLEEINQALDERRVKAERCLQQAFGAWDLLVIENYQSKDYQQRERCSIVLLSILLLGKTLEHAIMSVSQHCDKCTFQPWVNTSSVPWRRHSQNKYLTDRMKSQEWCPTTIEILRQRGNLPLMYYTSILGPPARKGHSSAGCLPTDRGCRMLNISTFPYKPLHTKDCPQVDCGFVGPGEAGMDKATLIIERGGIPIIHLDQNGELQVEEQKHGREYTAISHVWADGLGHPENENLPGWCSNRLLECQVRNIVKLIAKLPWTKSLRTTSEVYDDRVWKANERFGDFPSFTVEEMKKNLYFWIDTICIPHNAAKGKAIAQMAAVYGRANRVLVLDADMMATTVCLPNEGPSILAVRPNFGARLLAAAWPQRYWTLQEAVLAKRLWFQCEDDAYERKSWSSLVEHDFLEKKKQEAADQGFDFDPTKLPQPLDLPSRPNFEEYWWNNEICYYAEPPEYSLKGLGIGIVSPEKLPAPGQTCPSCPNLTYGACATCRTLCARAFFCWDQLKSRGCSKAADEPLCMAILLDMDASVFANVTDQAERIRKLWSLFTVVPAGLLCLPSPKCKEPSLRWAPSNLDHLSKFGNPIWHPAHLTPKGVRVTLHGFTAKISYALKATAVIPIRLGDMVYYVRNQTHFGNERWVEGPPDARIVNVDFRDMMELGVILGHEPLGEGEPFPDFPAALGALVSVRRREEGDVLVGQYIGAVSVIGKGTMFERFTKTPWTSEEEVEKDAKRLIGHPTPVNQRWLLEP